MGFLKRTIDLALNGVQKEQEDRQILEESPGDKRTFQKKEELSKGKETFKYCMSVSKGDLARVERRDVACKEGSNI